MNNDHVHTATAKLKTSNINFASFFAKPPNKIPANISGYTVYSKLPIHPIEMCTYVNCIHKFPTSEILRINTI